MTKVILRDVGQRTRVLLPTTTEVAATEFQLEAVTYYLRTGLCSTYNAFIAPRNGVKNRIPYVQGHLVMTTNAEREILYHIDKEGHLIVTADAAENYSINPKTGRLSCTFFTT